MPHEFIAGDRVRFTRCEFVGRGGTVKSVLVLGDGRQVLSILPDGSASKIDRLDDAVAWLDPSIDDTADWVTIPGR